MYDELILWQVKQLNETIAKHASEKKAAKQSTLASEALQADLQDAFNSLIQQRLVLLPPEASASYCSKCGKKLSES
jgi:hypothetical protein